MVIGGLALSVSPLEWCALVMAIGAVLVAEALNTSIERIVDMLSPEIRPLAGNIKDLAAAAVLLAAFAAATVGGMIFAPKLLRLL